MGKELYIESKINAAKRMKIDLNEKASHIVAGGFEEVKEYLKGAENGAPFIVIPRQALHSGRIWGYFAMHDKENDILIYIYAVYKNNAWMEASRSAFFWDEKGEKLLFFGLTKGLNPAIDFSNRAFDICGQAVVDDEAKVIVETCGPSSALRVSAAARGYLEELYSFFKGDIFLLNKHQINIERLELEQEGLLEMLFYNKSTSWILRGDGRKGNGRTYFKETLPPLPDAAMERMKKFTSCCLGKYLFPDRTYNRNEMEFLSLSCLQEVDGVLWQRSFSPYVIFGYKEKDIKIELFETARRCMPEYKPGYECGPDKSEPPTGEYRYLSTSFVVWSSDLKGTYLKYVSQMLDKWLQDIGNIIDGDMGIREKMKALSKKMSQKEEGVCPPYLFLHTADILAKSPVLEMMCNADFGGKKKLRHYVLYSINAFSVWDDEDMADLLGGFSDGKRLHDILGVPKCILEYAADRQRINLIPVIKSLFCTENDRKYLRRMDKESAEKLIDYLCQWYGTDMFSQFTYIIKSLFLLYGCRKWDSYMEFLANNYKGFFLLKGYRDYIDILMAVGEPVKGEPWRISCKSLEKKKETLKKAYALFFTDIKKKAADGMIKNREQEFKALCYENKDYCMRFPRNIDDIIKEGADLHHCAAEFVDTVKDGKTILLFVRKTETPDKPFYTLEIRNNEIRQCHGFANSNIEKAPGLDSFLLDFCTEKNIKYKDADRRLGV